MDCPYTVEQYQALVAALAQGVRVVEYADKKLEYRSLAEMRGLKREMEDCLGISDTSITRPGRRLAVFNSGK